MRVEDYLDLPYRVVLMQDEAADGLAGWVAEVEELPGCLSQGKTPDEVMRNIRDAMRDWISTVLERKEDVPLPREQAHSGRFLIRLPKSLHGLLAREAAREGVSLNQFVTGALAASVHWRDRTAA
jgi:antitoxin HicB